jgi:hypothetical protein
MNRAKDGVDEDRICFEWKCIRRKWKGEFLYFYEGAAVDGYMKNIFIIILLGLLGAVGLFVLTSKMMADKPKKLQLTEASNHMQFQNGDISSLRSLAFLASLR